MMKSNFRTKFWAILLAFMMALSIISLPTATVLAAPGEAKLDSLTVRTEGGTDLLTSFSSDLFDYTINVENSIDVVYFHAESADPLVLISPIENEFVSVGENIYNITCVLGEISNTYQITINRSATPSVVDIAAIPGVTPPVKGAAPAAEITETEQYTGTVSWNPADDLFAASTAYTATITLTPKSGYTLTGVTENFFTVSGAESVSNAADSGVITAVFPATGAAEAGEEYEYTVTDGNAAITGYLGDGGDITIPPTLGVEEYPVTVIGNYAFAENEAITGVTIPEGVTVIEEGAFDRCSNLITVSLPDSLVSIGSSAFYAAGISSVDIPANVTSIGAQAFATCYDLAAINVDAGNTTYSSVGGVLFNKDHTAILQYPLGLNDISYSIPSGVTAVGAYVFKNSYIESVVIPAGVTVIGEGAFWSCESLENVTIPDSVTIIDQEAFYWCTSMTEMNIPAGVTEIGAGAFTGCGLSFYVSASNANYASADGVLFDKGITTLIRYPVGQSGISYSIPATVTVIESGAFAYSNLREIIIPNGVTNIGNDAFYNCEYLYSIEIPDSVTNIQGAFLNCTGLKEIVFMGDCPSTTDYEYEGCEGLTIYYVTGKTGFPAGEWNGFPVVAFDPAAKHTLTFDANGGSGIAPAAVSYAWGEAVTLPDGSGLTKQYFTFAGWNTEADGSGVSYAAGDMYEMGVHDVTLYAVWQSDCMLESLAVYDYETSSELSLTPAFSPDVYGYTVSVYNSISTVYIEASTVSWEDWVYWESDYYGSIPLQVGENVIEVTVYSSDEVAVRTYTVTITRLDAAAEKTFGYFKYIDEESYITITGYTGREMDVTVPAVIDFKPVTKIGPNVCVNNPYVQSVTLPEGIVEIGGNSFSYCYGLKSVTLPDTLTRIGGSALAGNGFRSIDLPDGLLSLGKGALQGNELESIVLPGGITRIEADVLSGCANLASVTLPGNVTYIGSGAFSRCESLESIVLPEGLLRIDAYALAYCTSLASITIPDSVEIISNPFLEGCVNLETISVGSNPNFAAVDGVLFNADKTELIKYPAGKDDESDNIPDSYNIPDTVTDIYEAAFDSAQVGSVTIPSGVTELLWTTFENCESLTSVTLPDTLEYIDQYTFYNCTALASIALPASLYGVDGSAFYGCTGLTSVSVDLGNENYWSDEEGVLYGYDWDYETEALVYYPAGKGATSFTVPDSVGVISYSAFSGSGLSEINMGNNVTAINWGAFEECDSLTSITIPDSVEELLDGTFIGCDNLSTATIGSGVLYLDTYAFYDCQKLAAVYLLGNAPDTESYYEEYGRMMQKVKSFVQHAPQELKDKYSVVLKTRGTIKARAAGENLFPGADANLTVYKAYGTTGYTNPWNGRPVKTFYPDQTCNVTFNLNGKAGTAPPVQTVYKYGKIAQPLDPVNPDNKFLGWYKEASGVNKWNFAVNTVTSNMTLYAKWSNTAVITVKSSNSYWGTVTGGGTYNYGAEVTLTATPKQGYRFQCYTVPWSGYNLVVSFDEIYTFTADSNTTITVWFSAIEKPVITSAVSPKYDTVTLKWSGVYGVDGYNVFRAASSSGPYIQVAEKLTDRTYTDTGLQWGKTYYYKVNAYHVGMTATTQGALSAYKSIKTSWQAPALTASSDHNYGIELSWTAAPEAESYYVWRSTYNGGYTRLPDKVAGTSYLDAGTALNKTYYYKVQAVDETPGGDVVGPLSAYKAGKAAWTPVKITTTPAYNYIDLSWNAVTDADCYYVWRSTAYNTGYAKLSGKVYGISFTDEAVETGKTYYYKVQPVDETTGGDVDGPLSAYKYAKAAWPAVTLKASSLTYTSIALDWNDIEGADKYEVYRNTTYSGTYTRIDTVDVSTYTDTALATGKTYYYKIRPLDETESDPVYGPYSSYKYAKPAWSKITLKALPNGYNSVILSWNEIAEADFYEVYRSTSYSSGYVCIDLTDTGSYTDLGGDFSPGLVPGKTYYYKIRPVDGILGGSPVFGPYCSYKYAKPAWPVVKLSAASGGYDSIVLDWNDITGADKYEVYRNTTYSGTYSLVGTVDVSAYTDEGRVTGKTYYYKIRPFDETEGSPVYGPYSSYKYAKAVPSAPVVTLSHAAANGITGIWAAIEGASGYEVYRATSKSGTYSKVITTTGLSFWDTSLTIGKTYYYKVRAFTMVGTTKVYGAYSAVVSLMN